MYDIPWQIVFSLACQQLWLARNSKIFNDEEVTARTIIAKVRACASWSGECIPHGLNHGRDTDG